MDPATAPLLAAIIKAGTGYALALWFYFRWDAEMKDRRATEKAAVDMILQIKDRHHAETIAASNAQTDVLSANARMIESHTATAAQLTAEVRELAAEIRRRPAVQGAA